MQKIHDLAKQSDQSAASWSRLPGVGPVIATAVLGHGGQTRTRSKTAGSLRRRWGLYQDSAQAAGARSSLGITKRGDAYLRKLLVQGRPRNHARSQGAMMIGLSRLGTRIADTPAQACRRRRSGQ